MIKNINNNVKIVKMNSPKNSLPEQIKNMLGQVLDSAKIDISEEKKYPVIIKRFVNSNRKMNCNYMTFAISQDSDNLTGHMLEVIMSHPSKEVSLKRPLAYGTKEQIVKFLEQKDSIKYVEKDIVEMNKELSEYR